MTRTDFYNFAAIVLALGLATAAAFVGGKDERLVQFSVPDPEAEAELEVPWTETEDGERAIESADGAAVPVGDYERILTATSMAADALLEFSSGEQIIAIPTLLSESKYAYRYGATETVDELSNVERIVSLRPDLVVFHQITQTDVAARLRERGIHVLDLGSPTGATAWAHDVVIFGALLGYEERAREAARDYLQRLRSVADDVPEDERPSAIVLSSYGEQFFGGASGTSYHDVLVYAGLKDAAADYNGWPQFDPEDIMQMNPDWIVTTAGMEEAICTHPVLEGLRACSGENPQIIGVPEALFSDAGLRILDAAEYVHRFAAPYAAP
jgi:iron complex transport system substrate-binding protein